MIATCWHFVYGIWLFAAKWGITPGDRARKRFGYVCAVLGVILVAAGLASIYAFIGPMYKNAPPDLTPAQITEGATAPPAAGSTPLAAQ
jgi:succinate dehydrogenase / fumarate reductase cytochrome b subunit